MKKEETICALATPEGIGAIGVIRLSGPDAIEIVNSVFPKKDLSKADAYTIHFGALMNKAQILDEVLVSIFRAPRSYTGEDVVELSFHGSPFILQKAIELFLSNGARLAKAGEFTQRAFLNRKMDLSQAEAVADLIAAESSAAHETAMHQMRGGFSKDIDLLRERLIHFASMIELELDFSEEDVEFANRNDLMDLLKEVSRYVNELIASFDLGNVIKNGVPVVIAGKPNAGKSTLLNALFKEERALVTDIEGTTRDSIEDELVMDGISYRFIDTAGLRETADVVESLGVKRSLEKIKQAAIVIYLYDASKMSERDLDQALKELEGSLPSNAQLLVVANHIDKLNDNQRKSLESKKDILAISAKSSTGIEVLAEKLKEVVLSGKVQREGSVVTNSRHLEALKRCSESLDRAMASLQNNTPGDLLAMDIRQALFYLGEITGEVTTDDLLGNIFSKFCIGK